MERVVYLGLDWADQVRRSGAARIVTPNRRAAARFSAPYVNLDALARQCLAAHGQSIATPLQSHRALSAAVAEVVPGGRQATGHQFWAPSVREVLRAGIDLDALATAGSVRARQVAAIAAAFRRRLRAQSAVDQSEALTRAASLPVERQALIVCGYPRLSAVELAFIDAVAGPGSRVLLPAPAHAAFATNEQAAADLQSKGWVRQSDQANPPRSTVPPSEFALAVTRAKAVTATAYPNTEAEARGVLGQVKALFTQGVSPDTIALVARDDTRYGPIVAPVAWEYGMPLRAYYQVPLHETRTGAWVGATLDAIQSGFAFEKTAAVLAHPLGPRLSSEQWTDARKRHPAGIEDWSALGIDLQDWDWPSEASYGEWLQRLQRLIDVQELRHRGGKWPVEVMAAQTLIDNLIPSGDDGDDRLTLGEFADHVRELLALLTVPAQPGRGGVALHTPLSLFGSEYRHVFVLGMGEGMLPAGLNDDPVLDYHERKRLATSGLLLESAVEAAQREQISLWALMQTATGSLHLAYPRLSNGKPVEPSAYFPQDLATQPQAGIAASPEEKRQRDLRRDDDGGDAILVHARLAWAIEQRREASAARDDYEGVVGQPLPIHDLSFSASKLVAFGQCAFRWFAAHYLKLQEPEEAEDELNPRLRGTFYHRVLELALAKAAAAGRPVQEAAEFLPEAFTQAERELPPLPNWRLRRTEHLTLLARAMRGQDFIRPDAEPIAFERPFAAEWHGLKVRGIVDRIDQAPEGLIYVDYKTSSQAPTGAKDAQGNTKLDIQLPLYVQAAAPAQYPGQHVTAAYYYSLTKGKMLKQADSDEEALAEFAGRIKRHVATGHYPIEPDADGKACTYCDLDPVCRRGPHLTRKEATRWA